MYEYFSAELPPAVVPAQALAVPSVVTPPNKHGECIWCGCGWYEEGGKYCLPKYTVSPPNGVRVAAMSVAKVPPEPPDANFKVFQLPTTSQLNELMDASVDPAQ